MDVLALHVSAPPQPQRGPGAGNGWIEAICGPMFSGKTEELIRRMGRAALARQQVAIFKPRMDQRYDPQAITSHSRLSLTAQPVACAADIGAQVDGRTQVVGVDEAQFFGDELVEVLQGLADAGRRVVVAGLDQDFRGQPFAPMPAVMAVAEFVTKTQAVCVVCGQAAGRTQRVGGHDRTVLIGAQEAYEARCRPCHVAAGVPLSASRG